MRDWSENAKTWMSLMGEFTPAADGKHVRGYAYNYEGSDGQYIVFRDADDLRKMAAACIEVAGWLEKAVNGATADGQD